MTPPGIAGGGPGFDRVMWRPGTIPSAALFGFSTGIRSAWPTFRLALAHRGHAPGTLLMGLAAVGEMGADKLAPLPARTAPGPLLGRVVMGARGGASLATDHGEPRAGAAVVGGLAALAGAVAAVAVRRRLTRSLGVPDWVVALGEDVVVVTLTELAVGPLRRASTQATATNG